MFFVNIKTGGHQSYRPGSPLRGQDSHGVFELKSAQLAKRVRQWTVVHISIKSWGFCKNYGGSPTLNISDICFSPKTGIQSITMISYSEKHS